MVTLSDRSKSIDINELTTLVQHTHRCEAGEAAATAAAILKRADLNRDGVLSFDEFKRAVAANQLMLNMFWTNAWVAEDAG